MATTCPFCSSSDTQNRGSDYQCLNCARVFDHNTGTEALPGPDQSVRDVLAARLTPREAPVVGNFADLQRMGAGDAVIATRNPSIEVREQKQTPKSK